MAAKPIKRNSSETTKFIIEAKFILPEGDISNGDEKYENLLAYSNRFGVAFLAYGSVLKAIDYKAIEGTSASDVEESAGSDLSARQIIAEQEFDQQVRGLKISSDDQFLAILFSSKLCVYKLGDFKNSVNVFLLYAFHTNLSLGKSTTGFNYN